ncbi:MAG: endonuclease/exonuclease/phosphatase family protein [Treponema sp.]|jgi:endonuclease/exonuclease/phosphatase family metal-dependent hydrolase|nr:endonuclease/exonuclease/phosphatase family protein [Treponema sp.]
MNPRLRALLFTALTLSLASCEMGPADYEGEEGIDMRLKVMTYNLRIASEEDGANNWPYRKAAAKKGIEDNDIDIVGLQEARPAQFTDLQGLLTEYTGIGTGGGNDDGKECPIFYKTGRFDCVDSGLFWLSFTPEEESKSWDSTYHRTAAWVILKDKESGGEVFFINTHLDHQGAVARFWGMHLILKEIQKRQQSGYKVVLTGDFNAVRTADEVAQIFSYTDTVSGKRLDYTRDTAETKTRADGTNGEPGGTSHDFGAIAPADRKCIDYIFVSGGTRVLSYEVLPDKDPESNGYYSDHNPVQAEVWF